MYINYIQYENDYSYLAVTDGYRFNWCKNEWEWQSLKVSELKIYNDANCTNITFILNIQLFSLAVSDYVQLNWYKYKQEWQSSKVSASKICNDPNCIDITLNREKNWYYLAVTNDVQLNWCKNKW